MGKKRRIRMGTWDCPYCQQKGIPANVNKCPNCGNAKESMQKYNAPSDDAKYLTEEEIEKIPKGPDWYCSYCGAMNHDFGETECPICGSPREDSKENYFDRKEKYEQEQAKREERKCEMTDQNDKSIVLEEQPQNEEPPIEDIQSVHESEPNKEDPPVLERATTKKWFNYQEWDIRGKITENRSMIMGVIGAVLIIALMLFLFIPRTYNVTVQDFSWERGIDVEEYRTVDREGWDMPSNGRLHDKEWKISGYESVLDHYETRTRTYDVEVLDHYEDVVVGTRDLGNGYFEDIISEQPVYRTETRTETYEEPIYRDEPIYDWYYYYEIDIWEFDYCSKSRGNDKKPYWKEPNLEKLQREGARYESYWVNVLRDDGEEKKYKFDYDTWMSLNENENVQIKANLVGSAKLVKDGVELIPKE